jgi:catalase
MFVPAEINIDINPLVKRIPNSPFPTPKGPDSPRAFPPNQNPHSGDPRGPFNKPQCTYHTYNNDGAMRFDGNGGSEVNYEPNSFGSPTQDPRYVERPKMVSGTVARHDHRSDNDHYTQPGDLFRLMPADAQPRLIGNIVGSLGQTPNRIQELQVKHFYKADPAYGTGIAKGLGLDIKAILVSEGKVATAD